MFFTKKYNYFSRETRWNNPFLSQSPLKGMLRHNKEKRPCLIAGTVERNYQEDMINTLFDVQKKKKIIEFDESWQKKMFI